MSLLHRLLNREGAGTLEAVNSNSQDLNRDLRLARRLRVNIALAGFALQPDDIARSDDYVSNLLQLLREFDAVMVDPNNRMLYIWLFDANRERAPEVLSRIADGVTDNLGDVLHGGMIGCAEFPVDGLTFDALLHSVVTTKRDPVRGQKLLEKIGAVSQSDAGEISELNDN